jgi:hypothetical protein
MPEQLSSFEQQREALAEKLRLREQYEQQIKTLNETGILEILPDSQELGIVGIDGKGYPVPKYEEILTRITQERIELLTKKFGQGFTQLLIVPFGMALNTLIDRYRRELLEHDSRGTLLSTDGQKLELDRKNPIYVWDTYHDADINGELVYEPQEFSENHQGKTKTQIIQEKGAWQVILVEDLPDLPSKGKGQTIAGRKQFEANQSSEEYLEAMQTDPQYQGEQGFNSETWLTLAIAYLHNQNSQIDDWRGQGKACLLTSCYLKSTGNVLSADWFRDHRHADLDRDLPSSQTSLSSTRTRVES